MHALDDITGAIIDAAMKIHREPGPGLPLVRVRGRLAREVEIPNNS